MFNVEESPLISVLEASEGPVLRALHARGASAVRCAASAVLQPRGALAPTVIVVALECPEVASTVAAVADAWGGDARVVVALSSDCGGASDLYARGAHDCFVVPSQLDALAEKVVQHAAWASAQRRRPAPRSITPKPALERSSVLPIAAGRDSTAGARRAEVAAVLRAGVAHDLKNVLAVIASAAKLALDSGEVVGEACEDVGEIISATARGDTIVRRLLALDCANDAAPTALDVNTVVSSITRTFQRAMGRDLRVEVRCEAGLPAAVADRDHLDQVLLELLLNARDVSPVGATVTVTTALRDLPGGPCVEIAVRDHGPGIDEVTRRRLFEPFFTTKSRGHGLGLAAGRDVVERMGGAMGVESSPGAGACFTVLLPARPPQATTTGVFRRLDADALPHTDARRAPAR